MRRFVFSRSFFFYFKLIRGVKDSNAIKKEILIMGHTCGLCVFIETAICNERNKRYVCAKWKNVLLLFAYIRGCRYMEF